MSSNNNSLEEATKQNPPTTTIPSLVEENDDNSEFDVSEAKENKAKSSENSPLVSIIESPNHPTTRSESSFNAILTDSGRVKRKCVVESEKRKLYLADSDSPPYMPIEEEIPQKFPRVKGRRGRPPKSTTLLAASSSMNDRYTMGMRRPNDGNQPNVYYHIAPYDGYVYTFSTALANVSCRLVMDGHFRSIVDHHKTLNFPQNVFTHEIIPAAIQHQKQQLINASNNLARTNPHFFNQPGPHMYRQGMPQMTQHIPQQQQQQQQASQQVYHNMMPSSQPIATQQPNMRQIPQNIPILTSYSDYPNNDNLNVYRINQANSNRRTDTPTHITTNSNIPPNQYSTNIPTHTNQRMMNSTNNSSEMNQHMTNNNNRRNMQPSSVASNSSTAPPGDNTTNATNGGTNTWLPNKNYQPPQPSYPGTNSVEKTQHSNVSVTSHHNTFGVMGMGDNPNISSTHRNDPINQIHGNMDNTDQMMHQSNNPTIFAPEKDL